MIQYIKDFMYNFTVNSLIKKAIRKENAIARLLIQYEEQNKPYGVLVDMYRENEDRIRQLLNRH